MFFVHGIFQVCSQIGQVEQLHYAYETSVLLNGGATELGIHCDCAASFPSDGYHRYPRDPLEVSRFSRGNARGSWFLSPEDFLRFRAAWLPYLDRLSATSHEAVPQGPWENTPHHWQQHGTCPSPTKAEKELHVPKVLPRCPPIFFGGGWKSSHRFFILAFFKQLFLAWNGAR